MHCMSWVWPCRWVPIFSRTHGTWPKRWSNLAPRSRDKRSPNYGNSRKNCLRSITGWGLTYPFEKYESVGMIIPPNMWKNKSHVPNHQPDYYSYSPYDSNITQTASWSPWVRAEYNELMENSSDATWGSGTLGSAMGRFRISPPVAGKSHKSMEIWLGIAWKLRILQPCLMDGNSLISLIETSDSNSWRLIWHILRINQ